VKTLGDLLGATRHFGRGLKIMKKGWSGLNSFYTITDAKPPTAVSFSIPPTLFLSLLLSLRVCANHLSFCGRLVARLRFTGSRLGVVSIRTPYSMMVTPLCTQSPLWIEPSLSSSSSSFSIHQGELRRGLGESTLP